MATQKERADALAESKSRTELEKLASEQPDKIDPSEHGTKAELALAIVRSQDRAERESKRGETPDGARERVERDHEQGQEQQQRPATVENLSHQTHTIVDRASIAGNAGDAADRLVTPENRALDKDISAPPEVNPATVAHETEAGALRAPSTGEMQGSGQGEQEWRRRQDLDAKNAGVTTDELAEVRKNTRAGQSEQEAISAVTAPYPSADPRTARLANLDAFTVSELVDHLTARLRTAAGPGSGTRRALRDAINVVGNTHTQLEREERESRSKAEAAAAQRAAI